MGVGLETAKHEPLVLVDQIRLVEDDDLREVADADIAEHISHGLELTCRIRVRPVDDVEDDVSLAALFQRRTECFHELMREVAHESDGVRQRAVA